MALAVVVALAAVVALAVVVALAAVMALGVVGVLAAILYTLWSYLETSALENSGYNLHKRMKIIASYLRAQHCREFFAQDGQRAGV